MFFASSIRHMVLPYHRSDYKRLPDEEKVSAAIRAASVTRGLYMFPFTDHRKMKELATQETFKQGPVGTMIIGRAERLISRHFWRSGLWSPWWLGSLQRMLRLIHSRREPTACRCFVSSAVSYSWLTGSAI